VGRRHGNYASRRRVAYGWSYDVTVVAPRRRKFRQAPRPSRVKSRDFMLSVDERSLNPTYRPPLLPATVQ